MTEEVTEMPRCCSSFIQSEVAWREALRPFTAPASWMAPPNRSSFSVRVVLPASGWEMMAKVRRRWISCSNMDGLAGSEGRVFYPNKPPRRESELYGQDQSVFTSLLAWIVVLAHPHFVEAGIPVQGQGRDVGEAHFQEHLSGTPLPGH